MFSTKERSHTCKTNELSGKTCCPCFMWTPCIVDSCTYCPLLGKASLTPSAHWGILEQTRNTHVSFQLWADNVAWAVHWYRTHVLCLLNKAVSGQKRAAYCSGNSVQLFGRHRLAWPNTFAIFCPNSQILDSKVIRPQSLPSKPLKVTGHLPTHVTYPLWRTKNCDTFRNAKKWEDTGRRSTIVWCRNGENYKTWYRYW